MRVLYIDDDRVNTLLFTETCRLSGGIELETAASSAEALEIIAVWAPDLLVVDLHLPDISGYELLPALRLRGGQADLPAILCTADDAAMVAEPAREAGFDGCWTKPVEVRQVLDELAQRASKTSAAGRAP